MAKSTVPAAFAAALKRWPKAAGPVVTQAQLDAAAALLAGRTFTQKHMALAMYLRPEGATQGQVQAVNTPLAVARNALSLQGDTQVNLYRGMVAAGKVTDRSHKAGNVKVYALTVGAPVKGKGKGKGGNVATRAAVSKAAGKAAGTRKAAKAVKAAPVSKAAPTATPEAGNA